MRTKCKLSELPVGGKGVVEEIFEGGRGALQLREMGILPGTKIELIRVAPLGDPLEIRVRGYHLSLRSSEAEQVLISVD